MPISASSYRSADARISSERNFQQREERVREKRVRENDRARLKKQEKHKRLRRMGRRAKRGTLRRALLVLSVG